MLFVDVWLAVGLCVNSLLMSIARLAASWVGWVAIDVGWFVGVSVDVCRVDVG